MRHIVRTNRPIFLVVIVVVGLALAVAACGEKAETEQGAPSAAPEDEMAQANTATGERVMAMAAEAAEHLAGEYGDLHTAVVKAGDRDNPEHEKLHAALAQIREETGATYVYTLIKVSDQMTNLIVDAATGDDADDYGTEYEMEPQMAAAFGGDPAYAEHTWTDESYGVQKSAFAPLRDSDGAIVAIIGIDFPAPELEQYPELLAD